MAKAARLKASESETIEEEDDDEEGPVEPEHLEGAEKFLKVQNQPRKEESAADRYRREYEGFRPQSGGAAPPAGAKPKGGLFDEVDEDRLPSARTPEQNAESAQKRRDTMTRQRSEADSADPFEVGPKSDQEWRDWATTLNSRNYRHAVELEKWLKSRGRTGMQDPKLSPEEKNAVGALLNETLPRFHNITRGEKKSRSPSGNPFIPR